MMLFRVRFGLAAILTAFSGFLPPCTGAGAAETLNIYNWSDYIAPGTLDKFKAETGIAVNYDTYDSNETLDGKLKTGHSGYDLVVPSLTPFLAQQIRAGIYQPLDKAKLGNYGHLDKSLLKLMAPFDKGNAIAIPWMTGTDGIGVNVDKVRAIDPNAPIDSLKLLFDPAELAKFKGCGVSFVDSPTDVFAVALKYLHLDPGSQKKEDLEAAAALLTKIRPSIRKFESSEYINDLANGDICVAFGYSSDINLARRRATEANRGVTIVYKIPVEGSVRWIDTIAIPKDAEHVDAALKFLDFILRPEVIAETSNAFFIMSGNADATPFLRPDLTNDPEIMPPASVEAKLFALAVSTPEIDRLRTRLWTRIKTGR